VTNWATLVRASLRSIARHKGSADLKKALYRMFSQFGPILDIVALKTAAMRGQVPKSPPSLGHAMHAH
jgi:hypothetical protein